MALHSAGQRAKPSEDKPGTERGCDGAENLTNVKKLVQQLLRLDNQAAALNIAVAATILRRGMKHDVRSEVECRG